MFSREFVQDIDQLLQQHQSQTADDGAMYSIQKRHWVSSKARTHCMNSACRKLFSITVRHHHCRKCGEVFCDQCTQYQMRLNYLAHPDPQGRLYKVCQGCLGPQTIGQCRRLKGDFDYWKQEAKEAYLRHVNGMTSRYEIIRNRLNIQKECQRLKDGFVSSIGTSGVRRSFQELKQMVVGHPDWNKSTYWTYTSNATCCYGCKTEFSRLTNKKHCCSVCGFMVCRSCSSKDLIVFIPDDDVGDLDPQAQLAVIKIVGCPQKEPNLCVYLRVCQDCQQSLEKRQIQQYQDVEREKAEAGREDMWRRMLSVHKNLMKCQDRVNQHLPKYQALIHSLGINKNAPTSTTPGQNNIQTLARAQGDLSDHFTSFVLAVEGIKKIRPTSKPQNTVLRNMVKSKYIFYQENMFLFRELKRELENSTSTTPEMLEVIQRYVEKDAIRNAYTYIKQLALEALHVCEKSGLGMEVPLEIAKVEEVLLQDLQLCIKRLSKEDWEVCETEVNMVVQLQLKENRILNFSTRGINQKQAWILVLQKCERAVRRIMMQVKEKCSDGQFLKSKEELKNLYQWIYTQISKEMK